MLAPGMTGITLTFFLNHPWDAFRFECWTIWQMCKGIGYGWAKDLTHSQVAGIAFAGLQLLCNAAIFIGMLLAWIRRKEWSGAERIVFWTAIVLLLVSSAVWADGRYRMVVDPLLLMLTMFTLRRQERISQTATLELTSFSN